MKKILYFLKCKKLVFSYYRFPFSREWQGKYFKMEKLFKQRSSRKKNISLSSSSLLKSKWVKKSFSDKEIQSLNNFSYIFSFPHIKGLRTSGIITSPSAVW